MEDKIKYLVIRFSSIGDIVLTTPVVRGIKEQVKNSEVHFLVKPQFIDVVKNNTYIDNVVEYSKENGFIDNLKKEEYNYIIDLQNNLRSARIKRKLNKPSFSLKKLNIKKWILVNLRINKLPDVHIVDRYMETLSVFDVKKDNKGLDYFIQEDDAVNINEFPQSHQNGYIAFVLGAKHATKKLPQSKIISLLEKLPYPIVLMGGKDEKKEGDEIASLFKGKVFNGCGKFSLNQSAFIVKEAKIVITHDTGLMHIAAAYKKKIISIWGNTIPEFGMYPYLPFELEKNKHFWIIEQQGLSCRPCSKIGYKKCPKKHFKCMMDVDEQKIVKIVNNNYEVE